MKLAAESLRLCADLLRVYQPIAGKSKRVGLALPVLGGP